MSPTPTFLVSKSSLLTVEKEGRDIWPAPCSYIDSIKQYVICKVKVTMFLPKYELNLDSFKSNHMTVNG